MVEVLYSDHHLLALNKPADLLTQPSGTDSDSLEEQAKAWVRAQSGKTGKIRNVFLHAVHRLDRPVSGIVLFARSSKALSRLNQAMREGKMGKVYLALVSPPPQASEAQLTHYLVHDDHAARVVSQQTPKAQLAKLYYRTLAVSGSQALLEIHLETGRYHQIRVQLSAIGAPVVNDRRYGGKVWPGHPGIGLHHSRLELLHPVGGATVVIVAPAPFSCP